MAINPPVDATKTPEWAALQKHYDELQAEGVSLKQWFADDAERVDKLSFMIATTPFQAPISAAMRQNTG